MPLWGGTDVMVDLNFGRARPEAILDLTRVDELAAARAGERPAAGRRRRHIHARDRRARRRAARAGDRFAHGRLAADPQPRDDRREPRLLLPRRRRAAAAVRVRRRGRARFHAGHEERPDRGLHHRPEAQHARAGRADRRVQGRARQGRPAVLQDRHPQRDGDRGLLVRARARRGGAHGRHVPRLGGADTAAGARGGSVHPGPPRLGRQDADRATRRSRGSASSSRTPRRRSTTSAAARRTAGTHSRSWRAGR